MNHTDGKLHENNKKIIKWFFIGITVVLLVIVMGAVALFWNELRTLFSLEKLDDYGAYQMTYYGDYGFDEFLEVGASSDKDIEEFVTKRLLKGMPIDLGVTGDACTAFVTKNEKGVAIALLAVPEAEPPYDSNKITLNTTTAIRLVLDNASTVEEAVELLRNYNIYFSGDIECHYLIADASGHSIIVEFYDGELQVIEAKTDYQIATNFIAYNGLNIGEGFTEFERYDMVEKELSDNNGILNENDAISLLAKVGVQDGEVDKLQWSVLYNLTTGDVRLFIHRDMNSITATKLKMSN